MPSPTETLFRAQLSPVPTQTILWLEGSMVTAPMDCTSCLSKTGLKVVAPLMDFHTPPLAEPTNTVTFPPSSTASMAAIRPLIAAEPILRADNPEMVPESYLTGRAPCPGAVETNAVVSRRAQAGSQCSLGRREQAIIILILLAFLEYSWGWAI